MSPEHMIGMHVQLSDGTRGRIRVMHDDESITVAREDGTHAHIAAGQWKRPEITWRGRIVGVRDEVWYAMRCETCGGPRDDEPREFVHACGCVIAPRDVERHRLVLAVDDDGNPLDCDGSGEWLWRASGDGCAGNHPTREGAIAAWRKERVRRLEERKLVKRVARDVVMLGTGAIRVDGETLAHVDARTLDTSKLDELCHGCRSPRECSDVTSPFSGHTMRLCEVCAGRLKSVAAESKWNDEQIAKCPCDRCPGTMGAHHSKCDVPAERAGRWESKLNSVLEGRKRHEAEKRELIAARDERPAPDTHQHVRIVGWEPVCEALARMVGLDISHRMWRRVYSWLASIRAMTLDFGVDVPCPRVEGDETFLCVSFPGYQYSSILNIDSQDERERETAAALARHYGAKK